MNIRKCRDTTIKMFVIFLLIFFICFLIQSLYREKENNDAVEVSVNNFDSLIAEYQTWYNEENENRSTNIKIAVNKVNGTIILPQEIFSYNDTVGKRTELEGFKIAHIYQDGKIVDGVGGGVCQLSSTLYNVALYANLEIVERKNHQFLPEYIEAGRDATVTDEYVDFKFKNTREYPIKLICSAENGTLKVQIYGKKEKDEYDIEIKSIITKTIPYKTIYEKDNTIKKGEQVIIQNGKNGYVSETYKITKTNGEVLSKTLISTDQYNVMNEIIKIGTKDIN